MITRIYAKGFKGLDFDQPLGSRTLIMGRVGSGKSARALALSLLVTGCLPGTGVGRNNSDILNAVGHGDSLTVGIEVDGKTLERTYKRKKNDTVGCDHRLDGEPIQKNLFEVAIANLGIGIADVPAFLALSDARQVDELFRLFPPAGDVRKISADINTTKSMLSKLEADAKAKEQSCQSLAVSIADLQLPAGSLPEVQAEIARLEREYQEARDDMTREKARLEHEARSAREAEAQKAQALMQPPASVPAPQPPPPSPPVTAPLKPQHGVEQDRHGAHSQGDIAALQRVLSALERSGCGSCAARMVLKRELKTMQEVACA